MRKRTKLITLIVLGATLLVAGSLIPYEDGWRHEAVVRQWDDTHNGFSGTFACHTADGGCLHFSCTTRTSCNYMQELQKKCAAPTTNDKMKIIEDDTCKSTEAATTPPKIIGTSPNIVWGTNGVTVSTN